jgi:hypothetical protein
MNGAGASTLWIRSGGNGPGGAVRRPRAAIAAAIAALTALAACETAPRRSAQEERAAEGRRVMEHVRAGLDLYGTGEFALAAPRFHAASLGARGCDDVAMERRTTAAECAAWLRARSLAELAECGARLEDVLRRERRSDPGASTLAALAAIAGGRALPALHVPAALQPLLLASAAE